MRRFAVPAVLLLTTTACWSGDAAEGMLEPRTFGDLPAEIDYVALGDSYSAGPLITTIRSDPSGCVRSTDNYPAFLAGWLSVETYTDVTCSAADTDDLTSRQRPVDGKRVAPQLAALSAETDLVTLGIGGNDFGIFSSLLECVDGCTATREQALLRNAGRVEQRVAGAVRAIAKRAPDAEVFVVGYPQVLPEEKTCRAVPLPPAQLSAAAEVAARLNASLRAGAEAGGAAYVDVDPASEGHDVCAGKAAWINGPQMRLGIAAPFHPVLAGMRGVAAEVFAAVTGDHAPAGERATPPRDAIVRN
ncbi:SGNH/GDSL hydrolase family protein [Nocardioides sp. B-3]|uniref:SGNH/GDSL hydrolase family protein n=1 Tax=Nocardioides sp. B-3 TaxID=2895565 RepID=UPI00215392CF|nr:SGNH/GDSL hydrolase family protein [Nocardioides sp. B-3]UUZ58058.1 SGNH/GDSL hydrolase family protein [Nocardioides sp. B-3]